MKRFELYQLAIEMIEAVRPIHARVRQHDREMSVQVKRAASSVPANIAEGARRQGADRLQHYRIAAGSASELRSHIAVAIAWGDLDPAAAGPVLGLLDRILAILWRLTHP
jgi:four helix bundle protein